MTAIIAVLIIAAAGLMYLQLGKGGGSDSSQSTLAALSQAIPLHAGNALAGDARGFERLEADLNQLRAMRGSRSGAGRHWDQLTQSADAILERRESLQAINAAADFVEQSMPGMLLASDDLLNESGATAVIQQFQQRGVDLQRSLSGLMASTDPAAASADIAAELVFFAPGGRCIVGR